MTNSRQKLGKTTKQLLRRLVKVAQERNVWRRQSHGRTAADMDRLLHLKQDLEVANRKLIEAFQAKANFLAAVSHNLLTPLNAIMGFTDVLLMRLPGPINEEQERQLNIMRRSSTQLLGMINQLLYFSKIENKTLKPIIEQIDLHLITHDLLQTVAPLADNKKLKLKFFPINRSVKLHTDKQLLRQIYMHLIDNAIKYTKKGSVTIVETLIRVQHNTHLLVEFIDTGIGIEEGHMENLFEAYSKISRNEGSSELTGVGLYLCRKFCDILGMTLKWRSTYGEGSVFSVDIPISTSKELL